MAKVTMIFEDGEDGSVQIHMDFDPPAQPGADPTPAQIGALKAMNALQNDEGTAEWEESWDYPEEDAQ